MSNLKLNKKKLYICLSYYHVYIALLKCLNDKKSICDIVICDSINDYKKLFININNSKIFDKVFLFEEKKLNISKRTFLQKVFGKSDLKKQIEKSFYLDFNIYKEVYIFNDCSRIGQYLKVSNVKYHLLEDGRNFRNIIKNVLKFSFKDKILILIKKIINHYDLPYGMSRNVIDIEVTVKENVDLPKNKLIEFDNNQLLNSISKLDKKKIYDIFIEDSFIIKSNRKKCLILTQPYFHFNLANINEQIKLYKYIIANYGENCDIYIKPHPRDNLNYEQYFDNIFIIDKNFPIEIINFNDKLYFEIAISITSTSLDSLQNVNKKILLGEVWINDYVKSRKKEKINEDCSSCTNEVK